MTTNNPLLKIIAAEYMHEYTLRLTTKHMTATNLYGTFAVACRHTPLRTLAQRRIAPMSAQLDRLQTDAERWHGSNKQTDDITLMGFRYNC